MEEGIRTDQEAGTHQSIQWLHTSGCGHATKHYTAVGLTQTTTSSYHFTLFHQLLHQLLLQSKPNTIPSAARPPHPPPFQSCWKTTHIQAPSDWKRRRGWELNPRPSLVILRHDQDSTVGSRTWLGGGIRHAEQTHPRCHERRDVIDVRAGVLSSDQGVKHASLPLA
ncbi:unnamed protein product [Arctogadus glacialis]